MRRKSTAPHQHGYGELAVSRYFALYLAMAGWLALGLFLGSNALWPSTCQPASLIEVYQCSPRLGEGRGWIESALMTWLWATPLLVGLEVLRQIERLKQR
jgi:hypothetical protein